MPGSANGDADMPAAFLLALQLLAAQPLPLGEAPAVIDLLAPIRLLRCPELRADEIVVCGHRPGEEDRLFIRDTTPWGRAQRRRETRLPGGIRVPF
jgi:hypothetical protein